MSREGEYDDWIQKARKANRPLNRMIGDEAYGRWQYHKIRKTGKCPMDPSRWSQKQIETIEREGSELLAKMKPCRDANKTANKRANRAANNPLGGESEQIANKIANKTANRKEYMRELMRRKRAR